MKKSLVFIATIVLIVGGVLLVSLFSNDSIDSDVKYNEDLLKLSENFDSKKIVLCEEIPIEEIFIPNSFLTFFSRPFFYTDIENYVKIENVQQTKYGFNIIFKSQNQTLFVATNFDGQIINMANFSKTLYKSKQCLKIKEGMSLDAVKKILPDSYLVTVCGEIFGASSSKLEEPYMEIVCKDGTFYNIYFVEKNEKYYVEDIKDYYFSDGDVIKSWKKLIKNISGNTN